MKNEKRKTVEWWTKDGEMDVFLVWIPYNL